MNERPHENSNRLRTPDQDQGNHAISEISRDDVRRLLSLTHRDPHSILGAHLTNGGAIIRAYRPEATDVFLRLDGDERREMLTRPEPGLFEIAVKERGPEIFRHYLE